MRAGSRGSSGTMARRARSALVVTEIAASIVLLVGAGLLARSLAALIDTDLGVNTENVMTAQLDLALGRTVTAAAADRDRGAACGRVCEAFRPSVPLASAPASRRRASIMRVSFVLKTRPTTGRRRTWSRRSPPARDIFDSLQIRLLKGRLFTDADSATASLSRDPQPRGREAVLRQRGPDRPHAAVWEATADRRRGRRERQVHRCRRPERERHLSSLRPVAVPARDPRCAHVG